MPPPFELIAGRLCLDFVNTVNERPVRPGTRDDLRDYAALLAWSEQAGVLTTRGAQELAGVAAGLPARAQRALRDAVALRERLYRMFRAIIDGRAPDLDDLERFSSSLADVLARRQIHYRERRFVQEWPEGHADPGSVLWPVLLSAQQLLCSDDHSRLGACTPPDGCGWLYYDTSKNRSRRWCSMQTCGNSAKARRHYARKTGAR